MNNQGGFLLPEIAYIDKLRNGWVYRFARWIGDRFIILGIWIKGLGYYQVEIHPRKSLLEMMDKMRIEK